MPPEVRSRLLLLQLPSSACRRLFAPRPAADQQAPGVPVYNPVSHAPRDLAWQHNSRLQRGPLATALTPLPVARGAPCTGVVTAGMACTVAAKPSRATRASAVADRNAAAFLRPFSG